MKQNQPGSFKMINERLTVLATSIPGKILPLSRTRVYELISEGQLEATALSERKTYVFLDSIRAYQDHLQSR